MAVETHSAGAPAVPASVKPVRQPNQLVQVYLILFNTISMLAWSYTLALVLMHYIEGKPHTKLYDTINPAIYIAQSLALLELVHSLLGLVRSPFITALMQVSSRILLVWGILAQVPPSRTHWSLTLMVVSWCCAEIPRYAFYVINLVSTAELPYALKFVRYSLFLILYPTGITGEVVELLTSLPYVKKYNVMSISMPNKYNFAFSYHYALILALLTYIPGSYVMYTHMLKARKKQLSPATAGNVKKTQ